VLPSGYYTTPVKPSTTRPTEALRLCGLAFRRDVFDEFSFDESLTGPALKEDIDFSYRVSRRYKLLIVPDARFRHLKSPADRMSQQARSRMHVVNNYRFFRKNLKGSPGQKAAFAWAMMGRTIYELTRSLFRRNPAYIAGNLEGLRDVARASRANIPSAEEPTR
jgi:GT2 family glycosyltransferase